MEPKGRGEFQRNVKKCLVGRRKDMSAVGNSEQTGRRVRGRWGELEGLLSVACLVLGGRALRAHD